MSNVSLKLFMVAVVLLSGVGWALAATLAGNMNVFLRIALVLIGIVSIVLICDRDTFLPFLGECAFPTDLLAPHKPAYANVSIKFGGLPAGSKVVYWAAESLDPRAAALPDWKLAYGQHTNSGVAVTDDAGIVHLELRCPQPYRVSWFGLFNHALPTHVHYRYTLPGTTGMLSDVFTHPIAC